MSDASVIHDVSATLRALLDARLNASGVSGANSLGASVTITVESPQRPSNDELRINLFLYHVLQDEGRRNSGGWLPVKQTDKSQTFAAEPLALKLCYVVTAFASDGLTEHRLLGEAMQALYHYRRIPPALLQGALKNSAIQADQMEIVLLNLEVDTLHKIWGNMSEPLRASAAYEVGAVFLDSLDPNTEVPLIQEVRGDVVAVPWLATLEPESAAVGATVRVYGANLHAPSPDGTEMAQVFFGPFRAPIVSSGVGGGSLTVVVPAQCQPPAQSKPGPVEVTVRLGTYISRAVAFYVEAPA